jgi:membrane protease YdiL (CAAX protease family)
VTNTNQIRYNSKLANNPRPAIAVTLLLYVLFACLEALPGTFLPAVLCFLGLGVLALYIMPYILGLPNGRKSLRDYCQDIRLLPVKPLGRNILLGFLLAALTLGSIFLASLLTGHFILDWSYLPALRWVKGLTRGIWEEVFFRGIVLVLFMRVFSKRLAIFFAAFFFALMHLNPMTISLDKVVDVISIFFMGLLFIYVVLKTGSLLPAIIFHYFHDIFLLVVQNTPGADETLASTLLFAFLWAALIIGAVLTKYIVEHWSIDGSRT